MNQLQKIYCRIYQTAFRIAMPVLPYRVPKIFRNITAIPPLVKKCNISNVLLVTDQGLRKSGVTAALEELLDKSKIRCVVYDKTCANPTVHNVEEARELYVSENCEGNIAFGGGYSYHGKTCGEGSKSIVSGTGTDERKGTGNIL